MAEVRDTIVLRWLSVPALGRGEARKEVGRRGGKDEMAPLRSDGGETRSARGDVPAPVTLSSLLDEQLILCGMKARTKQEAIEELSSIVAEKEPGLDKETIIESVLARERECTTAMGRGCAFPHAKLAGLDRIIVALGRCEAGINFDALDGRPVNLIVFFVTGEVTSLTYLATLAAFASLSRDSKKLSVILSAKSPRQVMEAAESLEVTLDG